MPLYRSFADAAVMMDMIEKLRAKEGDSVTILSDNPDFNGQPNCAIEVVGYWVASPRSGPHPHGTWGLRRFAADTVFECLKAAVKAKAEAGV